ncbi:MAG: YjbQ family protein [Oscillospiraceae bacterium]|nr:YjbQ family protein [Oscillospiraceae bacterium]
MKNFRQELTITTDEQEQFLNLSFEIEECVRRSMINEGICVVISQHSTAAVFLENDNEDLHSDWSKMLNALAPKETEYKVDYSSAGTAHLKQMLLGGSVTVPISDGRLELGPRQFIMYGDFDGCREKTVIVKIIGE